MEYPIVTTADAAAARAATTYNATADVFDDPVNSFWDRFGRQTVQRIALNPAERVLDVCCGSGASALPAAEAVGPTGSVIGVDLAENLLALARAKSEARGLANIAFKQGNLLDLGAAGIAGGFDAVICVFGVFFVPDTVAAMRALWSQVAPGGRLAVTTWGPRFFEPGSSLFWEAIRAERPDLVRGFNPWDKFTEPEAIRALFTDAGIPDPTVTAEPGTHRFDTPDDWWTAVLGTGYRGTLEALDPEARERVRIANLAAVRAIGLREVEANVVYAVATKDLTAPRAGVA